jgi:mannose/fructose-specific phosphotransferase system component IIA
MSEEVRGLIIAHSSLAAGLAAAVRQIAGVGEEAIRGISNDACGPDGLIRAVREAAGEDPVVLFTDLASGSCALAARKVAVERPKTGVVTGVNLPLLLDFAFHRNLPVGVLVDRLVQKGRSGIIGACTEEAARADRAISR